MAERVGFEPTCRLRDKTLSRRPRYDHFGTSPQDETAPVAGIFNYSRQPAPLKVPCPARQADGAGGNQHFRDNHQVDPRASSPTPPARDGVHAVASADERELVASILRRDRKAAARFVTAHIDAVYAYVRHRLMPRTDLVDDVIQDVFLAALNGLSTFQGQSSLRTWLMGIARHKIEDVYRQRLRTPDAFDDLEMVANEPLVESTPMEDQVDSRRARARVRQILVALPERYGLLLLWRYWEHRSTREIAGAVGTTEKSVERALARARARFRELWLKE